MRYVLAVTLMAIAAGCAKPTPIELSRSDYVGCLKGKPVEQCQNEKARLDADIAVSNAQSQRMISAPPLVLSGYQPARQPIITCTRAGTLLMCD